MKPLIASHKENKRYLLIKGESENIKGSIERAILQFSGIIGMSKCGLNFIKQNKGEVIISINREAVDLVRASISILNEKIEVSKVSGTLKGLKKQKFPPKNLKTSKNVKFKQE